MKWVLFVSLFCGQMVSAQLPSNEVELIKTYKKNLINKDLHQTILSLKDLITYYNDQTHYHISIGYLYQLQNKNQLSQNHFLQGRTYILEQLRVKELTNKQILDHIVALCFAEFDEACKTTYFQFQDRFMRDKDFQEFDYETIKQLAQRQRQNIKEYFIR